MRLTLSPQWYLPAFLAFVIATPAIAQETNSRAAVGQMGDDAQITATGCVKQQSDVPDLKPDIPLGQGDEFALTDASVEATAPTPTGTAGEVFEAPRDRAYSLTGEKERELKAFVGQQVEITGSLDTRDGLTTASRNELATVGTEEKLPRIKIQSFRLIKNTCPASPEMDR